MIKEFIIRTFPQLGSIKREIKAFLDSKRSPKKSYSQHKEDAIIFDFISKLNLKKEWKYVDVGGNHPSHINNTYLFYRNGYRGVIIEPNISFKSMYDRYRRGDYFIACGCGEKAELKTFHYSKTPVMSSFVGDKMNEYEDTVHESFKSEYLPIFPLSQIINSTGTQNIFLLSIDTEGFNVQVLKGAIPSLKQVLSILVEFDDESEKNDILRIMFENEFDLHSTHNCNLFFIRKNLEQHIHSVQ